VRAVLASTCGLEKRTVGAMDAPCHRDVNRAWRHAAESWLRRQGLIEVSINPKLRPLFLRK